MKYILLQDLRKLELLDKKISKEISNYEKENLIKTYELLRLKIYLKKDTFKLLHKEQIILYKEIPHALIATDLVTKKALNLICQNIIKDYDNSHLKRKYNNKDEGINHFFTSETINLENKSKYFLKLKDIHINDARKINTIIKKI